MSTKRLIALTAATALTITTLNASTASATEPARFVQVSEITTFTASNNVTIPYIKGATGTEGTLVFLDGDNSRGRTTPQSPFIQDFSAQLQQENMSGLFLLPPENHNSWWSHPNADQWAVAVRELLVSLDTPAIELAGYSGGAEFITRHLLLTDTSWVPANTSATMIGGGSIAGYGVTPPAPGKESMNLDWVVGEQDTVSDGASWVNVRDFATQSEAAYRAQGYTNTSLELVSASHTTYDFRGILTESVHEMKGAAPHAPVAPAAPAVPIAAVDAADTVYAAETVQTADTVDSAPQDNTATEDAETPSLIAEPAQPRPEDAADQTGAEGTQSATPEYRSSKERWDYSGAIFERVGGSFGHFFGLFNSSCRAIFG